MAVSEHQRNELAALMDWCFAERARIHYPPGDVRRTTVAGIGSVEDLKAAVMQSGGWSVDCSQMCYALLGAVGLKPPNQDGATGSMLADLLPHYTDARKAFVGALAVFGPGSGHHVAMVRHRDVVHGNPVVFSHGQESDPRMISLLTEAAHQPAPVTLLSIAHL